MGKRTIVLVVALLLAAVAAFSVWVYLNNIEDDIRADIVEVPVFRATARIEAGVEGAEALAFIEEGTVNQENLPPAAVESRAELEEILVANITAGPISERAIITTDMWIAKSELESAKLSDLIEPGKVAVSIPSTQIRAAGGYIKPGDKVNLLASDRLALSEFVEVSANPVVRSILQDLALDIPDTTLPPQVGDAGETQLVAPEDPTLSSVPGDLEFTETVLQSIEVLAVGAQIRDATAGTGLTPVGGEILTLEVTPDEAEVIVWLQEYASVQLVLVPEGYLPVDTDGVIVDEVYTLIERMLIELEERGGR